MSHSGASTKKYKDLIHSCSEKLLSLFWFRVSCVCVCTCVHAWPEFNEVFLFRALVAEAEQWPTDGQLLLC